MANLLPIDWAQRCAFDKLNRVFCGFEGIINGKQHAPNPELKAHTVEAGNQTLRKS